MARSEISLNSTIQKTDTINIVSVFDLNINDCTIILVIYITQYNMGVSHLL